MILRSCKSSKWIFGKVIFPLLSSYWCLCWKVEIQREIWWVVFGGKSVFFFLLVVKMMVLKSCFWLGFSFWVGVFSSPPPLILSFIFFLFPPMFPCTFSFSSSSHPLSSPTILCPNPSSLFAAACCLARWSFGSPKCWCRCLSALQTFSMWCYVMPTGGVRMFWAGYRS